MSQNFKHDLGQILGREKSSIELHPRRSLGNSMRLGRRSLGNSMRLGKRAMGDSMRLGKRESWAAEDPWMQDSEQLGAEDYDVDKRAFGDSIRLGKRSR